MQGAYLGLVGWAHWHVLRWAVRRPVDAWWAWALLAWAAAYVAAIVRSTIDLARSLADQAAARTGGKGGLAQRLKRAIPFRRTSQFIE